MSKTLGRRQMKSLFLALALLAPVQAKPLAEFRGLVVDVHDGDTITLMVSHQKTKIRLANIDAPELRQPNGETSRQALQQLAPEGSWVTVRPTKRDKYGRTVGEVSRGHVQVNLEMVRTGQAWVYTKYCKSPGYRACESEARTMRRGLWAGASTPEAPWHFRHPERK